MNNRFLLEISVESAERAAAAERGGADRLELCSNLAVGGLTPPAELMQSVRARVSLPLFAMVRPRPGGFVYADEEFEQMKKDIALVQACRMHGVVLGLLRDDGGIDVRRTRELVHFAKPLCDAGKLVTILPGGGITAANAVEIARSTGATEFHAALSSPAGRDGKSDEFEREVVK